MNRSRFYSKLLPVFVGALSMLFVGVYPNPFVESTKFQLSMPRQACITIDVYDIKGGHIETLWPENGSRDCEVHPEGEYDIKWDGEDKFGNDVPPGIYVCVLVSDNVIVKSVKVVKAGLE